MSIENTSNLFHFEQTFTPDKSYIQNNNNNNYDEVVYPLIKIMKLKHDPKAAPEKKPVQYTPDIIVEIKNRDGTVVPMTALLNTGATTTNILR
jgi:hypothetical protein